MNIKMSLLEFIPKKTWNFLTFCNVMGVVIILSQVNNTVNISQFKNSNLTNGNYTSEILRRSKRQEEIVAHCKIPNYGLHVRYAILGQSINNYHQPGDSAPQYNVLEISCGQGYQLSPFSVKQTICLDGKWSPSLTINCLQTCPSLNPTMSTNVTCKYHDVPLDDCKNPVVQTTAFLTCNPLHEEDPLQKNTIRLCSGGRWIPPITECYPICGTKRPKGSPNIVQGKNVTVGDYPWQVGIYDAKKELLCGGAIIDRHIILTAAHCVTDYEGNVNPIENYYIAAGKYYRKYDDHKDEFAQYSKALSIHVPERYTGQINYFALDIAIIILIDPFTISLVVQPVCMEPSIELNGESPYLHLSINNNITITGWGYTEEGRELSEVLKELVIPYIPFRKCFDEVPTAFRKFITTDKICGGYLNKGTSVCGGDSGGGMVFKHTLTERYYIKGIVSTSPAMTEAHVCDSNAYSLYTSFNYHYNFIRNLLVYNQIPQSIEYTEKNAKNEGSEEIIQTCPSLNPTMSTNVTCKYHDIPLEDCKNPKEQTTAFLTCNPLYEEDPLQKNRIRLCRAGRWIPPITECYPICGTKRPYGSPNMVQGKNVTVGDYPWQVGIYNSTKDLICGGAIIDRHVILTAAHCVTDYEGNVNPIENYYIAGGKYYRIYDDNKDEFAQYSKVLLIHVPERYTGLINYFALDIAIIILTDPFTISLAVQPVCIEPTTELNGDSPYLHLSINNNVTVTGWGYTEEGRELSEVLKELVIPYIPFRQCFDEVPNNFRKFITPDKICFGTSVCGGDSGGGMVFKHPLTERYYIKGIISTSPSITVTHVCDSNAYSLYTSVNYHYDFIRNLLVYHQIPQSIEFAEKNATNEEDEEIWNSTITSAIIPPAPPSNLSVVVSSENNAHISWNLPLQGNFSSYKLKISALTPEHDPKSQTIENIKSSVESGTPYVVRELTPGVTYQVQIFSVSEGKESATYTSSNFTLRPNAPEESSIRELNETTLILNLNPPRLAGYFSHYKITLDPPDAIHSGLYVKKEREPPSQAHATVRGLIPGRKYNIDVQTISEGKISTPVSTHIRTMPLRPVNVKRFRTSTSFRVHWEAPNGTSEFDKFHIHFGPVGTQPFAVRLRDEPLDWKFKDNLKPGQTYHVSIMTVSGSTSSRPATADVTLIPLPVIDVIAKWDEQLGTQVALTWSPNADSFQDSYLISYQLYEDFEKSELDNKTVTTRKTTILLGTLLPGHYFTVAIQAVSKHVKSNKTSIFVVRSEWSSKVITMPDNRV